MKILAIETSCDETAVSIVDGDKVLAHLVSSQTKIHAPFGGVVPILAKREHEKNLPVLLKQSLFEAELRTDEIDLIAVTAGPGLEPALWAGITFAENLAKEWQKPLVAVNHLAGHIASVGQLEFPALALLVSGGHTELVLVKKWGDYQVLGRTRDDAVGEAFDKVARLLGLPFPGGPALAKLASSKTFNLDPNPYNLPRPMIHSKDLDFSFAGLKTAVRYLIEKTPRSHLEGTQGATLKATIAAEFQQAVIDVLIHKTQRALNEYQPHTLIIAGGVSANTALREAFVRLVADKFPGIELRIPPLELSTDNATMIALAAYFDSQIVGHSMSNNPIQAKGNLTLEQKVL